MVQKQKDKFELNKEVILFICYQPSTTPFFSNPPLENVVFNKIRLDSCSKENVLSYMYEERFLCKASIHL